MILRRVFRFVRTVGLLLIIGLLCALLNRCANPVAPTGGIRDELPPKVVSEIPENYSSHFDAKRIKVVFDEFIALDNPQKNLLISPPLENQPSIRLAGKGFEIKIEDSLKANTTYTFYFSNAIADITEGNKIGNYSYVFSTGDSIDMFGLNGKVIDALTGKPEEDMAVMLYQGADDSLPFKERPWYVARTDKHGEYQFFNVGQGPYKLFALADANSNFRYDMPNERVAFADSLIYPYALERRIDSATGRTSFYAPNAFKINLSSFDEAPTDYKILKAGMGVAGRIDIEMNKPGAFPKVIALNLPTEQEWMRQEMSRKGDSLQLWLFSPYPDTLVLQISIDSTVYDTATIYPNRAVQRNVRQGSTPSKPILKVDASCLPSGKHAPGDELLLSCSYPCFSPNSGSILLIEEEDTLSPIILPADGELKRKFLVEHTWKESTSYKLILFADAFMSINGLSHDTLTFPFTTYALADLGSLKVNLNLQDSVADIILNLLSNKGEVIDTHHFRQGEPSRCKFQHLLPGDYSLQAIIDSNHNGFWDAGTIIPPKQAEKVMYHTQPINIKANWDLDVEWKME